MRRVRGVLPVPGWEDGVAMPGNTGAPVAAVKGLKVTFERAGEQIFALRGVDLEIAPSEIVALVGESGSGKSVLGLSLLGLLGHNSKPVVEGTIEVAGAQIGSLTEAQLRRLRRESLGAVFQDPMTSLNPTMRIGKQLAEVAGSAEACVELLRSVGVPDPARRLRAFPFELSGGLRQRVMIAMALAGSPKLIVADEPTTALDVTVQAQILELIRSVRDRFGTSFLLITHDLGVAATVADRVVVMYGGRVVETGRAPALLGGPEHPYTRALLRSRASLDGSGPRRLSVLRGEGVDSHSDLPGCSFAPRCELAFDGCSATPVLGSFGDHQVACWRAGSAHSPFPEDDPGEQAPAETPRSRGLASVKINDVAVSFKVGRGGSQLALKALRGVTLDIEPGGALAIVGESGSGKSTLLRAIAGLAPIASGGVEIGAGGKVQMVFQDSGASLTPWMSVEELLEERLAVCGVRDRQERRQRILEACDSVGLYRQLLPAKAGQLSGGQRQRAALARAVVVAPEVLLCDEPTSALDVSLAAIVLNLIADLRERLGMTLLFVTHDLAVARVVADHVAVMYLGEIVEVGTTEQILKDPQHPYTRSLIDAVPESGRLPVPLKGEPASPLSIPAGCSFHPRCPGALAECGERPQILKVSPLSRGHFIRCEPVLEELTWR